MINKIILASQSEIRKQILEEHGFEIITEISRVDEEEIKRSMQANKASCVAISKSLAEHKANRISAKFPNAFVLGADQVLDLDGECISKPENVEEAQIIIKKLTLGRLETSESFKAETKPITPKPKTVDAEIETLKINVRDITADDIETRKLEKNLKGVVVTSISSKSPVAGYLQEKDIILEVQKNKVSNSKELNSLIEGIYKKGEQTLLLLIINANNQRRYIGIKTN